MMPGACEATSEGFQKIESIKVRKIPDSTSDADGRQRWPHPRKAQMLIKIPTL